jgi:hypothetical protein
MYCYIINYFNENNFYRRDVLQFFKDKVKEYNLIFDLSKSCENIYINDDYDIKIIKTQSLFETSSPEYYKCNYDENIVLYINEYNMIVSSKTELDKIDLKNILDPEFPLIIFFY